MANEVEIKVTSKDQSGPGFDGARGRMRAFTKDADNAGRRVSDLEGRTKRGARGFGLLSLGANGMRASLGLATAGFGAAAVGVAGLGIITAKVVKDSVQGWQDHLVVAHQTEAVLKSTGNAAHVTADQVGDLGDELERKTTIDGDVIQSGENMLLTFTNIRNEAGKGNDIFTQATSTLLDMAKATGTDASKAAVTLGKALNDPIKGVGALSRVGVTFTDVQKKQIENFVKTGDVASAQKVILGELNKEFGGSAESGVTGFGRLQVAINQAKDAIGQALLPTLDKVSTWLSSKLPQAVASAQTGLAANKEQILKWAANIAIFFMKSTSALLRAAAAVAEGFTIIDRVIQVVIDSATTQFAGFLRMIGEAAGVIPGVGDDIKTSLNNAADGVETFGKKNHDSLDLAIKEGKDYADKMNTSADAIDAATGKIQDFRNEQQRIHDKKVQLTLVDAATKVAQRIRGQIAQTRGKTVTIGVTAAGTVQAVQREIDRVTGRVVAIQVGLVRGVGSRAFAHGGIIGAAGGGPRSGLTMVGEHGRELVDLPPGSRVRSNPDTERMLGAGGGGTVVVEINLSGGDRHLLDWLRNQIRVTSGGNVQAALGRA